MKDIHWNNSQPAMNNFLARIIGIIGEDITKFWLSNVNCEYINCGRPTIYWGENQRATLDFLIRKKESDHSDFYLVEQKNFFAYQNGNLRTIDDVPEFYNTYDKWSKSKTKSSPAWKIFNELNSHAYRIKVKGLDEVFKINGTILIWGAVNELASLKFKEKYGFHDVIGLVSMVEDLISWKDQDFEKFVLDRERWTRELFNSFK